MRSLTMASKWSDPAYLERLRAVRDEIVLGAAGSGVAARASQLLTRLERRLARPPRLAIVGEVNTGKTTLANRLIGAELLSTDILHNTRVPVLLRYAATASVAIRNSDGRLHVLAAGELRSGGLAGDDMLEVAVPLDALRGCEVIDTPGLALDDDSVARTQRACRMAHAVAWCTVAAQAWRATDVMLCKRLAIGTERPSVLVVTHADQLAATDDIAKVRRRVNKEASSHFASVAVVGAADVGAEVSDEATTAIRTLVAEIQQKRCWQVASIVGRFSRDIGQALEEPRPAPAQPPMMRAYSTHVVAAAE